MSKEQHIMMTGCVSEVNKVYDLINSKNLDKEDVMLILKVCKVKEDEEFE